MGELKSIDTRLLDFPVDYVYRTVTDFASYSKWWPHEIKFDIEHLNPNVVGTTINVQNGPFVRWKSKITSFKVNKLLAIDYVEGAWLGKTQYRFDDKEGMTELTLEIDLEINRLWLKFVSLFLSFTHIHSKQIHHVFNNLEKYLAEHEGSYIHVIRLSHIDHIVLTVSVEVVTFGGGRKALKFGSQKINLHEKSGDFHPKAQTPTFGSSDICLIAHNSINQVVLELRQKNIEIVEGPVERTGAGGKSEQVGLPGGEGAGLSGEGKRCHG
jgi:ribosome-associated toxin RatA of RatAB toxin-antitoxin module